MELPVFPVLHRCGKGKSEGTDVGTGAIQMLAVLELVYPASVVAASSGKPGSLRFLFFTSFIMQVLLNLVNVLSGTHVELKAHIFRL